MKYLITYKLFESTLSESDDDVKNTMDDILLELEDDGFECHCNIGGGISGGLSVELRVFKYWTDFSPLRQATNKWDTGLKFWNSIEDIMNRIYSYLYSVSDKIDLYYVQDFGVVEEEILIPLKENTLKAEFPNYYNVSDNGFIIYFEMGSDVNPVIDKSSYD